MTYDVIVIGGGQSGLAVGYYLRRTGLSFVILDKESDGGGSWQHHWNSLRLFSPAQWSSLPGVIMQGGGDYYPSLAETLQYLRAYEQKYQFPIKRPVSVTRVAKGQDGLFYLQTTAGVYKASAVVSATGTFNNPVVPPYPGINDFKGEIIHSSSYHSADRFRNKRVAVVGEGNSGAQILAEVSQVAQTIWITQKPPRFLPDRIDGRYLFDAATQMYEAKKLGKSYQPPSLGDIVVVPPVKEARERNVYANSLRPFSGFGANGLQWDDGHREIVDAVIFCTGFKPALQHLEPLNVINESGKSTTVDETRSFSMDGLWFVGYGGWTGFASATLIGVGRSARSTVDQVRQFISKRDPITLQT
jgi:thioredoxin reductase